jgi:hypothetical protein
MDPELHIRLHQDAFGSLDDILKDFPFDPGQAVVSIMGGVIVIDLAGSEDTNILQEWFLNNSDDIEAFYIVDD